MTRFLASIASLALCLFVGLGGYVLSQGRSGPPGYRERALRYSREHDVEPELTLAVIEAESRGRPRAVSPAGAVGLMQLMPATARDLAARLGLPAPSSSDLFDEDLNIRLGTYYLGRLRRRFGDDPRLYLAAYNAGPGAVRRWQRSRPGLSSEELLASCAYPQTRVYVRKVLEGWEERKRP